MCVWSRKEGEELEALCCACLIVGIYIYISYYVKCSSNNQ